MGVPNVRYCLYWIKIRSSKLCPQSADHRNMNRGLYNILRKIAESPEDSKLEDRYLTLVKGLQSSEKTDALLDLSHLIVEKNPKKALKIARQVTPKDAEHSKKRAAKIIKLAIVNMDRGAEIAKASQKQLAKKENTRVTHHEEFQEARHTETRSRPKKSVLAEKVPETQFQSGSVDVLSPDATAVLENFTNNIEVSDSLLNLVDVPSESSANTSVPTDLELRQVPSMVGRTDEAIQSVEIKKNAFKKMDTNKNIDVDIEYKPLALDKTSVGEFQIDIGSRVEALKSAFTSEDTPLKAAAESALKKAAVVSEPKVDPPQEIIETVIQEELVQPCKEAEVENKYTAPSEQVVHEDLTGIVARHNPRLDVEQVQEVVRLKLQYQGGQLDIDEVLAKLDKSTEWSTGFIEGLIDELWGPHFDQNLLKLLEKSGSIETSPKLWGVYLGILMDSSCPRRVLGEIQRRIRLSHSLEWCEVAYRYLRKVSHVLHLQQVEWTPEVGGDYLKAVLSQRPTPGVLAMAV